MSEPASPMLTRDPMTAKYRSWAPAHQVAPDVWMHAAFVNTYAIRTDAGLVLVDPGLRPLSQSVRDGLRAWSDAPLHTAVYTHGHADHAFGLRAFLEDGERPSIVAQANLPARFRRYALTHGLNLAINRRQFSRPNVSFPDAFDHPTLTFRESLVQRIGKTEIVYTAAKGETDDHCYLWLPESRYLFTGDLVMWHAPNCGNPQKVQRYPVEWAEALEAMATLEPEWLFPGHGLVIQGRDAVRKLLTETAAYLRHIIDQVLTRMNAGEKPEDIFHAVEPHPELSTRPYLSAKYDHPKFIVRNLLRLWGGWWNGNAAELLPAAPAEQAREIANLAGGMEAVIARGRSLLEAGNAKMASHLAEWATQAEPGLEGGQTLKRDVYERRLAEAEGTMEQGIYRSAMNEARASLGQEPVFPEGRPGFGALKGD